MLVMEISYEWATPRAHDVMHPSTPRALSQFIAWHERIEPTGREIDARLTGRCRGTAVHKTSVTWAEVLALNRLHNWVPHSCLA